MRRNRKKGIIGGIGAVLVAGFLFLLFYFHDIWSLNVLKILAVVFIVILIFLIAYDTFSTKFPDDWTY